MAIQGPKVFKAAALVVPCEVRHLLVGLDIRPADILVRLPTSVSPGPSVPVACDVTKTSAFRKDPMNLEARTAHAVSDAAEKRKLSNLASKVAPLPNDS